ncbi:hypothetical protein PIB30_073686 [Stylosanthes scabra]|uniref:Uncharacterized protein n=1 Tax=Stylosanthes scabra TaxID=79078 RepID=A0ABU6SQ49_9FABA|nr:hypothetical protein [Stylosanthes scabra]
MNDVPSTILKLQKHGENHCKKNMDKDFVDDPLVVKSKGAPKKNMKYKKRRRCSNCGVIEHYNKSCLKNNGGTHDDSVGENVNVNSSNLHSVPSKRRRKKESYMEEEHGESEEELDATNTIGKKRVRSCPK